MILPYDLSVTTDRTLVCAMQLDPEGDRTIVILVAALGNKGRTTLHPLPILLQHYLHKLKYGYWIISEKEAAEDEAGIINCHGFAVAHRVDYFMNPTVNAFREAPTPVHSAMGLDSLAIWLGEVSIIHASFFYAGVMLRAKELLHQHGDLSSLLGPTVPGFEGRREYVEGCIRHFDLAEEHGFLRNKDSRYNNLAVLHAWPFPSLHTQVSRMYTSLDIFMRSNDAFKCLEYAPPTNPITYLGPSPSVVLPDGGRQHLYQPPEYGIPYNPHAWREEVQPSPFPPYGSGDVTLLGDIAEEYQFSTEMNGGIVSFPQNENENEDEDDDENSLMRFLPPSPPCSPPPPYMEE